MCQCCVSIDRWMDEWVDRKRVSDRMMTPGLLWKRQIGGYFTRNCNFSIRNEHLAYLPTAVGEFAISSRSRSVLGNRWLRLSHNEVLRYSSTRRFFSRNSQTVWRSVLSKFSKTRFSVKYVRYWGWISNFCFFLILSTSPSFSSSPHHHNPHPHHHHHHQSKQHQNFKIP